MKLDIVENLKKGSDIWPTNMIGEPISFLIAFWSQANIGTVESTA